jgi:hypothetical protein
MSKTHKRKKPADAESHERASRRPADPAATHPPEQSRRSLSFLIGSVVLLVSWIAYLSYVAVFH